MLDLTFTISSYSAGGKQANGILEWSAESLSISAISGPYGSGYLPLGLYEAKRSQLLDKSDPAYKDRKGLGWMQVLAPQFSTTRTDLGIHPDGNVVGTEGCIGIEPADTKAWFDAFKSNTGTLQLEVRNAALANRRFTVFVAGSGIDEHADLAEPLGMLLASRGYNLITGGRDAGVMRSVTRGFASVGGRVGISIGILPRDRQSKVLASETPNEYVDLPIRTHLPGSAIGESGELDPSSRNYLAVLSADVILSIGGGRGTRSEVKIAVELGKPVVVYGPSCEWHDEFANSVVRVSNPDDLIKLMSTLV